MNMEEMRTLYSVLSRIGKLNRRQDAGTRENNCDIVTFGLLFYGENPQTRVRMTDVSRQLMVTKPAATQAVNKLVENGLVERVSDAHDRRVVYIQPTENGRNVFEQEIEMRMAFVDRVVERMGETDANMLVALLDRFLWEAAAEIEEI